MRALWGKAPFQFDLREVPTPTPNVGEVLVRVTGCGICGTDLHFLRAMNHEWTPLGHELAACVEEVGAGVSRLQSGDSVIIENNSSAKTSRPLTAPSHHRGTAHRGDRRNAAR